MRFVDRYGEELITIRELFRSKQFIRGINNYYIFSDYITQEKEVWSFVENLHSRIPFNIGIEKLKEIYLHCGWCVKIKENDIKTSNLQVKSCIKKIITEI